MEGLIDRDGRDFVTLVRGRYFCEFEEMLGIRVCDKLRIFGCRILVTEFTT